MPRIATPPFPSASEPASPRGRPSSSRTRRSRGDRTAPVAFAYRTTTTSATPTTRYTTPITAAARSRSVTPRARTLGCRTPVALSSALMSPAFQGRSLIHKRATPGAESYSRRFVAGPGPEGGISRASVPRIMTRNRYGLSRTFRLRRATVTSDSRSGIRLSGVCRGGRAP